MKHLTSVLIVITLLTISYPLSAQADIKLGVAGPFTGGFASYGIPTLRAVQLVVNEVNDTGGVNEQMVTIVQGDDQCSSTQAVIIANDLAAAGVAAVVGHICSNATEAALAVYTTANIPAMSPASTAVGLTYSGSYPLFFRTIQPDNIQAEIQVRYALYVLQVDKIGLVHDESPYGLGLIDFVNDAINQEDRGEVLFTRAASSGIQSIVADAVSLGAEVLIYGGYDSYAISLFNEMRSQSPDMFFLGGDAVLTDTFLLSASDNGEGALMTFPGKSTEKYLTSEVRQTYIDTYGGEPGLFFMQAYAAAQSLLMAIDRADSTDHNAIKNILQFEDFVTPIGEISFDDRGDVKNVPYPLYKVENGASEEAFDGTFTLEQLKSFVVQETQRWDYNQNQKVDLPDTINSLRVSAGL